MLSETQTKGEIAFLHVSLRAVDKGMVLSRPTTDARYDAILDDGQKLWRVQVKYADGERHNADGAVRVDLRRKSNSRSAKVRTYTAKEIDLLLVYVPKTNVVLSFTPDHFEGKTALQLRLQPPKNNQTKGITLADMFRW